MNINGFLINYLNDMAENNLKKYVLQRITLFLQIFLIIPLF